MLEIVVADKGHNIYTVDSKHFHAYAPEKFNEKIFRPEHRDPARYLLHLITTKWHERDADGFVRLKTLYLRHVMGRDAELIRDALASQRIIEMHRHYVRGVKSFGYRLHPDIADSPSVHQRLDDKGLLARVKKHCQPKQPEPANALERALLGWLTRLRIEADTAKEYIAEYHKANPHKPGWYCSRTIDIDKIGRGYWRFVRDEYGRLHTNFSNLWSRLRQFCSVDGSALANIDIVNSQPLFLLDVLNKELTRVRREGNDIGYTIPLTMRSINCDLSAYARHVQAGTFYEHMMALTKSPKARDKFKKGFFRDVLFSTRRYESKSRAEFQKAFPAVLAMLDQIKAKEPRQLAWQLQRSESNFVIDTCCRRISTDRPDVPLLTIHDSITTTADHVDFVKGVMLDEFGRLGITPTLST